MSRFLVLTMRNANFDVALLPAHREFLDVLRAGNRVELAGAFADGSGGAYLLRAQTLNEAERIAFSDPLHTRGVSTVTVHEWAAQ